MTTSPWALRVWNDDSKSVLRTPTPITRFSRVSLSSKLNAPYSYTFDCTLSDYVLADISRGMYFELTRARSGTPALWCNGYLQSITKDTSGMACQISAVSALWFLSEFRTLGAFDAGPGINYLNVIDLFNGVPAGSSLPEKQGILPPGWTAVWLDDVNMPASLPPGQGDIWHGAWDTSLLDVTTNLQHYNIWGRESTSQVNYAYNGKLDVGPLGDSSGLVIWGGAPLLGDMQTNHSYPMSRTRADLGTAQALGYAVITNAQHQTDLSLIRNIVWVVGKGGHTINNLAGGPPLDAGGSLQNGWALFTPSHPGTTRPYWTKTATNYATYDGQVFSFIAAQEQQGDWPGGWAYGIVDITSVNTYGPCEYTLEELRIHDSRLLVSAAVGTAAYWGQPVESFTFKVAHPLTSSSGNPNRAAPGQTVEVHYSGQVQEVERDSNGQWQPLGPTFTYLDYPGTADARAVKKLKQVIQFDEDWSGGQYTQTITLGQNKTQRKAFSDTLAKQLLRRRNHRARVHSFKKYGWDGIPILCSTTPLAYERNKTHELLLNPGSIAVTDIPHSQFFTDGHKVSFTVKVTDGTQYLDFWVNKPLDNDTLLTPNPTPGGGPTRTYGMLRLAFTDTPNSVTNSAASCGFYTTSDGTTWTARGTVFRIPALDSSRRLTKGTYRVTVLWHGGKFECFIWAQDASLPAGINNSHYMCVFPDKNPQIVSSQWGALGWMLHQGTPTAALTDLHATTHHPQMPPKGSVNIAEISAGHPSGHRRQPTSSGGWGYSISHEIPN